MAHGPLVIRFEMFVCVEVLRPSQPSRFEMIQWLITFLL